MPSSLHRTDVRVLAGLFAAAIGLALFTGCDSKEPPRADGVVLENGLTLGAETIRAGDRYRVIEGVLDEGWANTLIGARESGNVEGIKTVYDRLDYLHYDNLPNEPICVVEKQSPVHMTDYRAGLTGYDAPIVCDLTSGQKVYATNLGPLR